MLNKCVLGAVSLAAFASAGSAGAQDQSMDREEVAPDVFEVPKPPILVTASRADSEVEFFDYAGSATVIEARDLELRQVRDLADILRDVPGIAVAGTPGLSQIRVRGSEANHVLVLIDGIEAASAFQGETDIGTLQADIGGQVEVLRGPQSALYGPDAIGGVISYRSASGRELQGVQAYLEGGTDETINGSARAGFASDDFDLAISANLVSTGGQPNARGGTRDLGRDSTTLAAKANWDVSRDVSLRAVGRYIATQGDFNNQDFGFGSPTLGFVLDTPGATYENEAIYALAGITVSALRGRWTHDLSGQIGDVRRYTFAMGVRDSGNVGKRYKGSYVTSIELGTRKRSQRFTFAADFEREEFRNTDPSGFAFTGERGVDNTGLVAEYRLTTESFDFSAALRRDINDLFADDTTYRVAAGFNLGPNTRLRGAVGSGSKNPGFYELYGFVDGRFIGNPGLQPESSEGWEIGFDQAFSNGGVLISATYFDSELENEIFTDFPPPTFIATPGNRDTVSTQKGVELALAFQLSSEFSLDANYTYLDAEESGVTEVRRPENTASAAITWTAPEDAASATLVIRHNGETEDSDFTVGFPAGVAILDAFTLVNLNARMEVTDKIELFGRVENLLDEKYEQVFTFVSPGRSALVGIRVQL